MTTGLVGDAVGWVAAVVDQMASIPLPILLLALALETCQTLLNALAWRNILRAAYPGGRVRFRPVLGAYAGGVALNAALPAQTGTVAMLGLYRTQIAGSTVLGLVGAGVLQSAFFLVVATLLSVIVVISHPGLVGLRLDALHEHPVLGLALLMVTAVVATLLWRRFRAVWAAIGEGAAILATPRRYASEVLSLQLASFAMRLAVVATFMHAYDVPLSARSVLLVIAANSLSSTLALTPGGVGPQQALASLLLRGYAPVSAVTAYSLGQQLTIAGWNVALGTVLLWSTIGRKATREFGRRSDRRRRPDQTRELPDAVSRPAGEASLYRPPPAASSGAPEPLALAQGADPARLVRRERGH